MNVIDAELSWLTFLKLLLEACDKERSLFDVKKVSQIIEKYVKKSIKMSRTITSVAKSVVGGLASLALTVFLIGLQIVVGNLAGGASAIPPIVEGGYLTTKSGVKILILRPVCKIASDPLIQASQPLGKAAEDDTSVVGGSQAAEAVTLNTETLPENRSHFIKYALCALLAVILIYIAYKILA